MEITLNRHGQVWKHRQSQSQKLLYQFLTLQNQNQKLPFHNFIPNIRWANITPHISESYHTIFFNTKMIQCYFEKI